MTIGVGAAAIRHPPRAATEVEAAQRLLGGVVDGDVVISLIGEDPQLGTQVVVEVAMAVEVVRSGVEQHGALRREGFGVLQLEARALADHRRLGRRAADQRCQRRADVAAHHDRLGGRLPQVTKPLGNGRLAVRPRHRDEAIREQSPGQLQLADDRDPSFTRGRDHRGLAGHPGALDEATGTFEQLDSIRIQADFDACLPQPRRALG